MADLDLARRAMKAAGWKQPGGQLRDRAGVMWRPSDMSDWDAGGSGDPLPDLDDGATKGCLLALVRERWGDDHVLAPLVTNVSDGEGGTMPAIWWCLARVGIDVWCTLTREPVMWPGEPSRFVAGPTMAEAAIVALEAPAPRQEAKR